MIQERAAVETGYPSPFLALFIYLFLFLESVNSVKERARRGIGREWEMRTGAHTLGEACRFSKIRKGKLVWGRASGLFPRGEPRWWDVPCLGRYLAGTRNPPWPRILSSRLAQKQQLPPTCMRPGDGLGSSP